MFTFGFSWRPWPGDRALADGPSILDYLRTVARGVRRRRADPLPAQGPPRELGLRGGAVDGRDRRWIGCWRHADHDDGELPVGLWWLLRLRRALRAGVPGCRRLRGPDRAPAAVAGGPRPRRPAGRGDRQRGHGHHAGAGTGRDRRPRDHAPAVPDVRRLPAGPRPVRAPAVQAADPDVVPTGALGQHPQRHRDLPALPPPARAGQAGRPQGGAGAGPRHRRRRALQAALQPVGPAVLRGAERRPVPCAPQGPGVDRHRHHRAVRRDRDRADVG